MKKKKISLMKKADKVVWDLWFSLLPRKYRKDGKPDRRFKWSKIVSKTKRSKV